MFLCVKKELSSHNLAIVLKQEIIRRVHLENIWQGIFATFTLYLLLFEKYYIVIEILMFKNWYM